MPFCRIESAPGDGCHPALLGAANFAVWAGRTDDEALEEIRAAIPSGRREVSDNEILQAIDRARRDSSEFEAGGVPRLPMPKRCRTAAEIRADVLKDENTAAKLRSAVLAAGGGELDPFGAEVRESSPIRLEKYSEGYPHAADMIPLLRYLYRPDDHLFIGRRDIKAKLAKTSALLPSGSTTFRSAWRGSPTYPRSSSSVNLQASEIIFR